MMKKLCLGILGVSLAMAAPSPAHALTPCQTACQNQYIPQFEAVWSSPHPASTTMTDYRQQVLAILANLNKCVTACGGTVPVLPVNLAAGQLATASISATGYDPARAVDNNAATYWWVKSTAAQWVQVDLGSAKPISKVTIAWGTNYASGYNVQVSADGATWTTVYSTAVGKGGAAAHSLTATSARYVRINCTQASGKNGYAITELGLY